MKECNIDDIVNIENECFSSPWTKDGIAEELDNPTSHFLVAIADNKAVGYIGVQEILGEAYITNIGVLQGYRRQGIGKSLLTEASDGAEKRDCEFITLEVRESNAPAIGLYEMLGFENVGMRKNFYRNPTENALLYTKNFRKETL